MRNSGARSGRYANAEVTIDANPFDGHVTSRTGTQCWTRTDATAPPFIKSVPPCVQRTRGGQLHVLESGQSTQPNNGQLTIHRSMIRRSNGNRSFGGTSYLFFFLSPTDRFINVQDTGTLFIRTRLFVGQFARLLLTISYLNDRSFVNMKVNMTRV